MRYLVILEALCRSWQAYMRGQGVSESTIESWGVYWSQLCMEAATCPTTDLMRTGHKLASSFSTCLYYVEEARRAASGT